MKESEILDLIKRPSKDDDEESLFDFGPDWQKHWWAMPEFSMEDTSAESKLTINFVTNEDRKAFFEKLGLKSDCKRKSIWFPEQKILESGIFYDGKKTESKYPICIPSKGRAKYQTVSKALDELGVNYKFFVEETEYDEYIKNLGSEKVVCMPFHDLGLGSIPARNFIWEYCKERNFKRHWVVDDNIDSFRRCNNNRRILVKGGGFFQAMEDFVDRYENVALAGPHHIGFVRDRESHYPPFFINKRIYSCILIDTSLTERWRGRYNEDTDLSLRVLKKGLCTVLFRSLLMSKGDTVGTKNSNAMPGGNTDNVYNTGDHRLAFAESLKNQHPDLVKITFKFNRWHHQVDYSVFKKNKLILKSGIIPIKTVNNYGMELKREKK